MAETTTAKEVFKEKYNNNDVCFLNSLLGELLKRFDEKSTKDEEKTQETEDWSYLNEEIKILKLYKDIGKIQYIESRMSGAIIEIFSMINSLKERTDKLAYINLFLLSMELSKKSEKSISDGLEAFIDDGSIKQLA